MAGSLQAQLKAYYNNFLVLIEQQNSADARKYLLAVLNGLRVLHESQEMSLYQKAQIELHMKRLYRVAVVLRTDGISKDIESLLGVSESDAPSQEIKSNESQLDWCASIFGKYKNGVVHISVSGKQGAGSGTGFIISSKGYLLTNAHVVVDSASDALYENLSFTYGDESMRHRMRVIEVSEQWDVALCKCEDSLSKSAIVVPRIKDYSHLEQGADIVVIGNAFSMGLAPFSGIVKFTHDEDGNLVYTAPSNPGDSGAPVFNRQGECVGINKSITAMVNCGGTSIIAQGLTNATPMDRINELLKDWCEEHDIKL